MTFGLTKASQALTSQDRFISKMFLRGDSVILVLRNPKRGPWPKRVSLGLFHPASNRIVTNIPAVSVRECAANLDPEILQGVGLVLMILRLLQKRSTRKRVHPCQKLESLGDFVAVQGALSIESMLSWLPTLQVYSPFWAIPFPSGPCLFAGGNCATSKSFLVEGAGSGQWLASSTRNNRMVKHQPFKIPTCRRIPKTILKFESPHFISKLLAGPGKLFISLFQWFTSWGSRHELRQLPGWHAHPRAEINVPAALRSPSLKEALYIIAWVRREAQRTPCLKLIKTCVALT